MTILLLFTIPPPRFCPAGQKSLIWCAGRQQQLSFSSGTLHAVCVERAKSPFSKWLKTSDPGAKLCGELLSFPLSRRPVIHARSVCFCAAVCGKQDCGVERRPLFEADLQVNDIWASSLIQLSVLETQRPYWGRGSWGKNAPSAIKPQGSSRFSLHYTAVLECKWCWWCDCLKWCICLMDHG